MTLSQNSISNSFQERHQRRQNFLTFLTVHDANNDHPETKSKKIN